MLPISITLSDWINQPSEAKRNELLSSLAECGAFYVSVSGKQWALLQETLSICKKLHDLPIPDKQRYSIDMSRGIRGFFEASDILISNKTLQKRNYSSFELGNEAASHSPKFRDATLYAANMWPLPEIRQPIIDYTEMMLGLGREVQDLLCRILLLKSDFFMSKSVNPFYQIRLLDYPSSNFSGYLGAHTDYECFSFISQSSGGLEVLTKKGIWVSMPPVHRKIVVVVGDLLEVISNGAIESALHRVELPKERRQSCIFFLGLDSNVELRYQADKDSRIALNVGDHFLARAIENFPHLRERFMAEGLSMPDGTGGGNPFKHKKLSRCQP